MISGDYLGWFEGRVALMFLVCKGASLCMPSPH